MIVRIDKPDSKLIENLELYSHGALSANDIKELLDKKCAMIVEINSHLITGITWNDESASFFGFHGEMESSDLDDLSLFADNLCAEIGIKKIQFLSPRKAWCKLLTPLMYKPILYVYEKEI